MSPDNTDFSTFQMLLSRYTPNLLLPPTALDLEYLHEVLLEAPQSSREAAPDSSPLNVSAPSSLPPQVIVPVDNGTSLCAVCSASTSLLPPPPPSRTVASPPPNWHKIPQMAYHYGQKQWDYTPSEYISFRVNGRPGMNMRDALRRDFTDLSGRDDLVLQDASSTISCRFSVHFLVVTSTLHND